MHDLAGTSTTPPRFLLGAALVFWGWHIGLWWLGLSLGLLAELPDRLDWRWELGVKERHRVADLCGVLLILGAIYLYFTQPRLGVAMILLIRWLPLVLFPLLAVQLYGERPGLELSTLFVSLRGRAEGERLWDPCPTYVLLCLVSAAMVPPGQGRLYLPTVALFAAWALWGQRRPRRAWLWAGAVAIAIGLGYALAIGLQQTQRGLEEVLVTWMADWIGDPTDPYRATTAIGDVGRLKSSERVMLRVRPEQPLTAPLLLRTATYNRYLRGNWLARHLAFVSLAQGPTGWRLARERDGARRVEIELDLDDGRGILPLPGNTIKVRGLEGAQLRRNPYGAVKVTDGPATARYQTPHAGPIPDEPPRPDDLLIPKSEAAMLTRIVADLRLADLAPDQALTRLHRWFLRDFSYSLQLDAGQGERTALAHFLTEHRAGHCEYFASASVLLLRQAGIPSRYVRGWSIQEYSNLEEAYVARARHAHAWVQVWVDGAWRDFDPTPPDWSALEEEARPWWGPLHDLVSRLLYLANREDSDAEDSTRLIWLLPPLVALLAWRIARRGRRTARRKTVAADRQAKVESPFAPLEHALAQRGLGRHRGETLREWAQRLEMEPVARPLAQAVELYYRRRFDPLGLNTVEASRLAHLLSQTLRG